MKPKKTEQSRDLKQIKKRINRRFDKERMWRMNRGLSPEECKEISFNNYLTRTRMHIKLIPASWGLVLKVALINAFAISIICFLIEQIIGPINFTPVYPPGE